MAMSSREVVRRAIEFDYPDRLPLRFASMGINDTHGVKWNQIGVGDVTQRETLDEWGCTWVRSEVANMGQVKGHPLLDWNALASYRWPDGNAPAFYEGMEERFAGSDGKYVITGIFMLLFERMHALRGFENTLVDLRLQRREMEELADRIVEFNLTIMENTARRFPRQIHGFNFSDDWGTELATFINPSFWDDFFKPRYKRIFDAAHSYGWHVWMHSCGKINAIMESLVEIGVDLLNLQQPRVLGIEEVGRQFRGRVAFDSVCDIQHTLPFKDADEISAEARLLLTHWSTLAGGFILGDYGDGTAIGVGIEKKQVMFEAFLAADAERRSQSATM